MPRSSRSTGSVEAPRGSPRLRIRPGVAENRGNGVVMGQGPEVGVLVPFEGASRPVVRVLGDIGHVHDQRHRDVGSGEDLDDLSGLPRAHLRIEEHVEHLLVPHPARDVAKSGIPCPLGPSNGAGQPLEQGVGAGMEGHETSVDRHGLGGRHDEGIAVAARLADRPDDRI
jgi:hypothetical protein